MGYDLQRVCYVETKKVVWLIVLFLASVVVVQYFELPLNRDGLLSLLSTGKSYFSPSDAINGDARLKERQTYLKNDSSPSPKPKIDERSVNSTENDVFLENQTNELEMEDRNFNIAPRMPSEYKFEGVADVISPSVAYHGQGTIPGIAVSPTPSFDMAPAPQTARDGEYKESPDIISPSAEIKQDVSSLISPEPARIFANPPQSMDFSPAPMVSPISQSVPLGSLNLNVGTPSVASNPPANLGHDNAASNNSLEGGNSERRKNDRAPSSTEESPITNSPPPPSPPPPPPPPREKKPEAPVSSVLTISEMYDMLLRNRASSFSKSPLWPSAADQQLLDMRFQIEQAPLIRDHPTLYAPIYRNLSRFLRSYELMEQKLKVYIYDYKDAKKPVFHNARLKGIYASEGWFMKLLESSSQYTTKNPQEAHLFYLPFSSQLLASYVYVPNSHSFDQILAYLKNYVDTIKTSYTFWNRTEGEDHFLVACHDWGTYETKRTMPNCIRALCNADVKEGFQFGKDVSLPETNVASPQNPSKEIGGSPPSQRKILAFFAGQMHGYVRPILLNEWENKDPDMKIVGTMRKGYAWHMKNSKYCICARGYEVNSPRVVEAIKNGCVPVIISDNFVPPFFEILNWETFAVFVLERDIPNLKNILVSISERRYTVMQRRVKHVRQHFLWHNEPVKYDIFHMILHSIWYNRVFRLPTRR